jgi:hypothetical protein
VLRRRGRIQVKLDRNERSALLRILDELTPKLSSNLATPPRAYEDAAMQAEYERWVSPDVERGRDADVSVVRDGIEAGEDTLPLTEAQALAWLRAFNHLRIAAAGVLGIEEDGWETSLDTATRRRPEYGVLMALGYLQEELVAALES